MKDDNDNGRQFHITLNSMERKKLDFLRFKSGIGTASMSQVIRMCINLAAMQAGFDPPQEAE